MPRPRRLGTRAQPRGRVQGGFRRSATLRDRVAQRVVGTAAARSPSNAGDVDPGDEDYSFGRTRVLPKPQNDFRAHADAVDLSVAKIPLGAVLHILRQRRKDALYFQGFMHALFIALYTWIAYQHNPAFTAYSQINLACAAPGSGMFYFTAFRPDQSLWLVGVELATGDTVLEWRRGGNFVDLAWAAAL